MVHGLHPVPLPSPRPPPLTRALLVDEGEGEEKNTIPNDWWPGGSHEFEGNDVGAIAGVDVKF